MSNQATIALKALPALLGTMLAGYLIGESIWPASATYVLGQADRLFFSAMIALPIALGSMMPLLCHDAVSSR